jgi:hypothetical protein
MASWTARLHLVPIVGVHAASRHRLCSITLHSGYAFKWVRWRVALAAAAQLQGTIGSCCRVHCTCARRAADSRHLRYQRGVTQGHLSDIVAGNLALGAPAASDYFHAGVTSSFLRHIKKGIRNPIGSRELRGRCDPSGRAGGSDGARPYSWAGAWPRSRAGAQRPARRCCVRGSRWLRLPAGSGGKESEDGRKGRGVRCSHRCVPRVAGGRARWHRIWHHTATPPIAVKGHEVTAATPTPPCLPCWPAVLLPVRQVPGQLRKHVPVLLQRQGEQLQRHPGLYRDERTHRSPGCRVR